MTPTEVEERSVEHFVAVGEAARDQGGCPLETWALLLRGAVDRAAATSAALHRVPADVARGMAIAGLIAGRPGSWEAGAIVTMAMIHFVPMMQVQVQADDRHLRELLGRWPTYQVDGGQVIADALMHMASTRRPVIPDASRFLDTPFANAANTAY